MAININSIKCPQCGAFLPIEEGRTKCFCSYCGSGIAITNDNEDYFRHGNEFYFTDSYNLIWPATLPAFFMGGYPTEHIYIYGRTH